MSRGGFWRNEAGHMARVGSRDYERNELETVRQTSLLRNYLQRGPEKWGGS